MNTADTATSTNPLRARADHFHRRIAYFADQRERELRDLREFREACAKEARFRRIDRRRFGQTAYEVRVEDTLIGKVRRVSEGWTPRWYAEAADGQRSYDIGGACSTRSEAVKNLVRRAT